MPRPVAIITGAGRGIGRATALDLHGRGYDLALVARTEADLRETDALAGAAGLRVAADVARPESADTIVSRTLQIFGRVDALVHAAGVAPMLTVEQTTPHVWREVIDTNLSAAMYLARAVWPTFTKQKSGVI